MLNNIRDPFVTMMSQFLDADDTHQQQRPLTAEEYVTRLLMPTEDPLVQQ